MERLYYWLVLAFVLQYSSVSCQNLDDEPVYPGNTNDVQANLTFAVLKLVFVLALCLHGFCCLCCCCRQRYRGIERKGYVLDGSQQSPTSCVTLQLNVNSLTHQEEPCGYSPPPYPGTTSTKAPLLTEES